MKYRLFHLCLLAILATQLSCSTLSGSLGTATKIDIFFRPTREVNHSSLLIYCVRTSRGTIYFTNYCDANPERELDIARTRIASAKQLQVSGNTSPILVLHTLRFLYPNGKEYQREAWAIFYPDKSKQPSMKAGEFSGATCPRISGDGFYNKYNLDPSDKLVLSIEINWPCQAINEAERSQGR